MTTKLMTQRLNLTHNSSIDILINLKDVMKIIISTFKCNVEERVSEHGRRREKQFGIKKSLFVNKEV